MISYIKIIEKEITFVSPLTLSVFENVTRDFLEYYVSTTYQYILEKIKTILTRFNIIKY